MDKIRREKDRQIEAMKQQVDKVQRENDRQIREVKQQVAEVQQEKIKDRQIRAVTHRWTRFKERRTGSERRID